MKILAIESSCDETAAAVIENGTIILSNVIATSTAMHEKWGGIVPEVAAREQLKSMNPVLLEALSIYFSSDESARNREASGDQPVESNKLDNQNNSPFAIHNSQFKAIIENNIDAIAVTIGPGLIGSLLIGVECAKTLAFVTKKPIIPVNHVLAHMYANFIVPNDEVNSKFKIQNSKNLNQNDKLTTYNSHLTTDLSTEAFAKVDNRQPITFPAISLVVSGGHTELFLMTSPKDLKWLGGTIDDAAGEAFDKSARLLGFGSRGGLAIQEAALKYTSVNLQLTTHNTQPIIALPRPLIHDDTLNFSFSGLKTAINREWNKLNPNSSTSTRQPTTDNPQPTSHNPQLINTFAFEVQEAITDVLVKKTLKAAQMYDAKSILISGGVSANLRLREKFISQLSAVSCQLFAPPISLCTDNAAYIGAYAYFRGEPIDWHKIQAKPDLSVEIDS